MEPLDGDHCEVTDIVAHPVGGQGVVVTGTGGPNGFGSTELEFVETVTANTSAALSGRSRTADPRPRVDAHRAEGVAETPATYQRRRPRHPAGARQRVERGRDSGRRLPTPRRRGTVPVGVDREAERHRRRDPSGGVGGYRERVSGRDRARDGRRRGRPAAGGDRRGDARSGGGQRTARRPAVRPVATGGARPRAPRRDRVADRLRGQPVRRSHRVHLRVRRFRRTRTRGPVGALGHRRVRQPSRARTPSPATN